jgi:hypothetical protein
MHSEQLCQISDRTFDDGFNLGYRISDDGVNVYDGLHLRTSDDGVNVGDQKVYENFKFNLTC